jgi:hypothetical protein
MFHESLVPSTTFFYYDLNFMQHSRIIREIIQEHNPCEWWAFAALPFQTVYLKYMPYSCTWCDDSLLLLYDMRPYLKKILYFCLLKLLFQYYITIYIFLCYSVLSSVLIHSIIIHPKTITQGGNCNILGLAGLQVFNKGNKMKLRRPHAFTETLYKIILYTSQTEIKPLPIQTVPSLQVLASHQFPPIPLLLIFSCTIKFNLS